MDYWMTEIAKTLWRNKEILRLITCKVVNIFSISETTLSQTSILAIKSTSLNPKIALTPWATFLNKVCKNYNNKVCKINFHTRQSYGYGMVATEGIEKFDCPLSVTTKSIVTLGSNVWKVYGTSSFILNWHNRFRHATSLLGAGYYKNAPSVTLNGSFNLVQEWEGEEFTNS